MKSRAVRWILLLALLARLPGLGRDFWTDEVYSAFQATAPDGFRWLIEIEHAPPLFFLLLRAWGSLAGENEAALRLFTVGAGLAGAAAAARLAGRVAGGVGVRDERAAAWAALGVGFAAFLFVHSRNLRVYIVAVPAVLWWFDAGLARLRGDRSLRADLAWAALGAALPFLHYLLAATLVLGAAALLAADPARRTWGRPIGFLVCLLAALGALWAPHFAVQMGPDSYFRSEAGAPPPYDIRTALYAGRRFFAWALAYDWPGGATYHVGGVATAAGLALAVAGRGWFRGDPARLALGLFVAAESVRVAALWPLGIGAESFYALPLAALVWTILACLAAVSDAPRALRFGVAGFLLLLQIPGIGMEWANRNVIDDRLARAAWRDAAESITREARPGEAVLVPAGRMSALGWALRNRRDLLLLQARRDTPYARRIAARARVFPGTPDAAARRALAAGGTVWTVEYLADAEERAAIARVASAARSTRVIRASNPRVLAHDIGVPPER